MKNEGNFELTLEIEFIAEKLAKAGLCGGYYSSDNSLRIADPECKALEICKKYGFNYEYGPRNELMVYGF